MNRVDSLVNFLKSLEFLLAFFGLSSVVIISNIEQFVDLAEKYNIHTLLIFLISSFLLHKIQEKQIKKVDEKVETLSLKSAQDKLRANVRQLYKDYENVEKITNQHTIKYIYDLEERRSELKLNSYTQAMLKELINKSKG